MDRVRRRFIRLAGGGAVLCVGALVPGCQAGMPRETVAAWNGPPDNEADVRRWALSHALLAPNPHNMQPWIADIRTPGEIALHYDLTRSLQETDPYYRQLLIGCGAFVELAAMALRERGIEPSLRWFPQGEFGARPDTRPVAVIALTRKAGVERDPLFAQVRRRHTNRSPFESDRPADPDDLAAVAKAASVHGITAQSAGPGALRDAVVTIARSAWSVEVSTPRVWQESAMLTRVGADEIRRHRDGISIADAMPVIARSIGAYDPRAPLDPGSSAFKRILQMGSEQAQTAAAWMWLVTEGNGRTQQVEAGRAYVRLHLEATARGLALQPMSQVLQEYPEMASLQRTFYDTVKLDPARLTVQMLARLGYAIPAPPSPRRPLEDILRA
ncbi:MAG: twin-arginine translocation pathway signal protein [Betaproteobacteria bacterium]|nr:twin-arginine translocation pathway signal protein [Betaproteobacteria bacterium]